MQQHEAENGEKQIYRVQGFTCTGCAGIFEKNVKNLPGVTLVPYLPIPIAEPDSPLVGVTIGPKNNSDTSIIGLRHFLKHGTYSHISNNIYKSTILLRFNITGKNKSIILYRQKLKQQLDLLIQIYAHKSRAS
ncbi:heavy-metal-associated domain-containing protein [Paenibacillus harenae]|uniref:heavy-metal-associated domain-containing protein n=1 Tax=Paenibacillus harenae TaxID=306543 RepID=UPI00048EFFB4|nr:heavy-metal-associated domain-containing protein [Paenibacillus harenae]